MEPSSPSRRGIRALTLTLVLAALPSCSDSTSPDKSGTFLGPVTAMAGGTARTYITLDHSGAPTDVGFALTEAALTGLPTTAAEYVFALPVQASVTPYKHAVINWMPVGHPPAGVYTVPHFDFHFYMITNADRVAIVLGDPQVDAKIARQPSAEFVPAGYAVGMPGAGMGLHWNDPNAPERNGAPFTKTFIYGSYDGTFTFTEPMIAKAYLETKPSVTTTAVKLPAQYAVHGYQPTSYTVAYDGLAKEYRIAISSFVMR